MNYNLLNGWAQVRPQGSHRTIPENQRAPEIRPPDRELGPSTETQRGKGEERIAQSVSQRSRDPFGKPKKALRWPIWEKWKSLIAVES